MQKFEVALEERVRDPDFLCLSGSRLYGTNREDSDIDYRGFVFPPFEALIGVRGFNVQELEGDHKVFSAKRFLELVLRGDPQCTEMFFITNPEQVFKLSPIGQSILDLRKDIISNTIYHRITGYGYSEWRKAKGERLIVDKRTPDQETMINDIHNLTHLDKADMDLIVYLIESGNPRKVVHTTRKLGSKRKAEFEKYGFGVSCASHSLRLMYELRELITTGEITFPRPEADLLRSIRRGEKTLAEIEPIYEEVRAKAEECKTKSVLPDKPNLKKVWQVYTSLIKQILYNDERFRSYPSFK